METRLVPQRGYPFFTVQSGAVKNQGVVKRLTSILQLLRGVGWALQFLRRERPVAVVGVGGYVSVPTSLAAFILRIPLFLQEQNTSVGIANRWLGKLARKVFLGFAEATPYFPKNRCSVTGNPIRAEFYAPLAAYAPEKKNVLILGGSQGARAINELVTGLLEVLTATFPGISIVHQTGERDFETVKALYQERFHGPFEVVPFIQDVAAAYTQASLVVSRSGALTVSELIQVGRPAIFIPYPRVGQNDQTANAALLERIGAARVVEQGDRFKERFWKTLLEVFAPAPLLAMAKCYSPLRRENALVTIGDQIEQSLQ